MEKLERELACHKEDLASRLATEVLFRLCPLNAETLTKIAKELHSDYDYGRNPKPDPQNYSERKTTSDRLKRFVTRCY